ncbi:MAG: FAD-dependent oxidoreductase [Calditrichaeota bacterium]|nr:MAG: FAD-dependent oxidoreductase [Calditrichota bacterium]
MNTPAVVIVGGGIAGISAAVHALERGWHPILLERTAWLGGRARSVYARDIGRTIDNGQHVLSAGYRETRRLLQRLGSADLVRYQERLEIEFRLGLRRRFHFRSWLLPPPLHFWLPLLLKAPLTAGDRKFLWRWPLWRRSISPATLKHLTVKEWLKEGGSAPLLPRLLWEPLTRATLNTTMEQASAYLLDQVLRQAFLGTARECGLGLPAVPLGKLFGEPGGRFLKQQGATVRLRTGAAGLALEQGRVTGVHTGEGEWIPAEAVILALPPEALRRICGTTAGLAEALGRPVERLVASPIITFHFWLRRPLPLTAPTALIDSPVQWIFEIPSGEHLAADRIYGYTAVISAAGEEVEFSREQLQDLLEREIYGFFGKRLSEDLGLQALKIVKEKAATVLQSPEFLDIRPPVTTGIPNLFLAGDWIDTGLPATIESAALSGRLAAERLPG